VNVMDCKAEDKIFLSNICSRDEENLKFMGKLTDITVAYVEVKIRSPWLNT
jgi:hypothetical protein